MLADNRVFFSFSDRHPHRVLKVINHSYLLEKIDMKVSASFEVKIGSGSSLKYCLSMSAMS